MLTNEGCQQAGLLACHCFIHTQQFLVMLLHRFHNQTTSHKRKKWHGPSETKILFIQQFWMLLCDMMQVHGEHAFCFYIYIYILQKIMMMAHVMQLHGSLTRAEPKSFNGQNVTVASSSITVFCVHIFTSENSIRHLLLTRVL